MTKAADSGEEDVPLHRPALPEQKQKGLLREIGSLTISTYKVSKGFVPLLRLLATLPGHEAPVGWLRD